MTSVAESNASQASAEEEHVEILLLVIKECFVYKVPPLRTFSGHRAEDWNLAKPVFTGCLRIFQADTKLRIALYKFLDPNSAVFTEDNILLFAECPIELKPGENILGFVDSVIDSSRYFVIKFLDPRAAAAAASKSGGSSSNKSSRSTYLGVGFRERDQAFDFKNCLNDYTKFIDRMALAGQMAQGELEGGAVGAERGEGAEGGGHEVEQVGGQDVATSKASAALAHYKAHINPLKDGEKIKVSIGGKHGGTSSSSTNTSSERIKLVSKDGSGAVSSGKGGFSLKPPPPPGSTVHFQGDQSALGAEGCSSNSSNTAPAACTKEKVVGGKNSPETGNAKAEDDWGDFSGAS